MQKHLGSYHQVGGAGGVKSHWLRKAAHYRKTASNTWSALARLSLSSAMFSPMKMLGFSNRTFNSSSIQSRHFFHMSACKGASGWISSRSSQKEKTLWGQSCQLVPSWRLPGWGCSRTGRQWCWILFSPWRLDQGCSRQRSLPERQAVRSGRLCEGKERKVDVWQQELFPDWSESFLSHAAVVDVDWCGSGCSYLSVPFLPLACRISFSFFTTTGTLISVPLANILGFSWWQQAAALCGFKLCFSCSE